MKRLRILFILAVTALAVLPGAAGAAAAAERASVSSGGVEANGQNYDAAISAHGRFVAFASRLTNIHPDDTDTIADIYVRDRQTNTTTIVSRAESGGNATG